MADDSKEKKKDKKEKKKKKEEETSTDGPEPEAPESTPVSSRPSSRKSEGSKKAKRTGSNVFDQFSQRQVAEFKEGFQFMDHDRDGLIGKMDLRMTFDELGKIISDEEIEDMLNDTPGPVNFTMLINMFAERQQGGASDDDEVVAQAFRAFVEEGGVIDSDIMRHALMTWGEKYSSQEVDDFFDLIDIDERGKIDCSSVIEMITGKADQEAAA